MPRKLVWTQSKEFQGYGCSECVWVFRPSGALVGDSLDKMKRIIKRSARRNLLRTFAKAKFRKTKE